MKPRIKLKQLTRFLRSYPHPLEPTIRTFQDFLDMYIEYGEKENRFTPAFQYLLQCLRSCYGRFEPRYQDTLAAYIEDIGGVKNFGLLLDTLQNELINRLRARTAVEDTGSGRGETTDGVLLPGPGSGASGSV